MKKHIIHLVMAARPNMMKIAPLYHALKVQDWADPKMVHTGQHYDDNMSGAFLRDFGLPDPHHHLGVGSGTHGEQTGRTLIAYEALCQSERPALCVVVGDVNATIACALAAKKLNIPVAHMEAGLRSFDRTMPEEINRLATDAICDYFWTPSHDATAQLVKEGVDPAKINEVGNIMIDSYCLVEDQIKNDTTRTGMGLNQSDYAVVTFHRPANVDDAPLLGKIVGMMEDIARSMPIVFPVHPRTAKKLAEAGLMEKLNANPALRISEPLSYIRFMNLVRGARLIVTDSGGVQEETSYLGIPCLTLRTTTERPITVTEGTNRLCGFDTLTDHVRSVLSAPMPPRPHIKGWDGQAAARTVAAISQIVRTDP